MGIIKTSLLKNSEEEKETKRLYRSTTELQGEPMKEITVNEYEKIKENAERLVLLGIRPFTEPKHLWMKKVIKAHRRNSKFQGMTGINWQRLVK